MRSSHVFVFVFLGRAAIGSLVACKQDNCLRVMTNTPLVASSFCSTFLQSTTVITVTPTITVNSSSTIIPTISAATSLPLAPTHISSQCVLATATPLAQRLPSACSCLSVTPNAGIVTSTVTAPPTTTTISAAPVPADVTCDMATFITENGKVFDIDCGMSYLGYYANSYAYPTWPSCLEWCAQDSLCLAANWVANEKYCTLSSTLDEGTYVWYTLATALKVGGGSTPP